MFKRASAPDIENIYLQSKIKFKSCSKKKLRKNQHLMNNTKKKTSKNRKPNKYELLNKKKLYLKKQKISQVCAGELLTGKT